MRKPVNGNKKMQQLRKYKSIFGLLILNVLVSIVVFNISIKMGFGDEKAYLMQAKGLLNQNFSSWYFLDTYYPETHRTPGYPMLLAVCIKLFGSKYAVQLVQLLAWFASLYFSSRIVLFMTNKCNLTLSLFLIFTALSIQLPYYSGLIAAESFTILFLAAYLYLFIAKEKTKTNAIFLGILAALVFQMRPSFLLFPCILLIASSALNRGTLKYLVIHLFVFIILLLPFTLWNKTHHGVWKATSLEGGGGVAHMGYWQFKLPPNYKEKYYWGNNTFNDLTNPFVVSSTDAESYLTVFEKEWVEILNEIDGFESEADKKNLRMMKDSSLQIFPIHNSKYTIEREKLLWEKTLQNVLADPWYYIKTRLYVVCRVYFTGINADRLRAAQGFVENFKELYPFLVTFVFIFLGLLFSILHYLRIKGADTKGFNILLLVSIYYGVVHTAFAIQARYTVPVHLCILILLSVTLVDNLKKNQFKE